MNQIKIRQNNIGLKITVENDEFPECPNNWGGPQVFNNDHGDALRRELVRVFGGIDKAGVLANGAEVKAEGRYYYGFEEYRHGGSAFALCGTGNFPDRRWDVIELAGWVEISEGDAEKTEEGRRQHAEGVLRDWQSYVNGEVYCYTIEMREYQGDGWERALDEASCCGFVGDDEYCKQAALEEAQAMARAHDETITLGKWEDYE